MITFLRQVGKGNDAYLTGVNDAESATHFCRGEDRKQYPIGELVTQMKNKTEEKPLDLPVLNFENHEQKIETKKQKVSDDILELPSMDFGYAGHEENQIELKMHEAGKEEQPLELPRS